MFEMNRYRTTFMYGLPIQYLYSHAQKLFLSCWKEEKKEASHDQRIFKTTQNSPLNIMMALCCCTQKQSFAPFMSFLSKKKPRKINRYTHYIFKQKSHYKITKKSHMKVNVQDQNPFHFYTFAVKNFLEFQSELQHAVRVDFS